MKDISDYQPWRQTARGKATCTTDMCIAQDVQQENHSVPIDRKDIAAGLKLTESIQISPNRRFC